jgi:heterodisulfide reductase subunit A
MATNAKTDVKEKPRIGVFVCHCGSNIGGFVDVPSVAKYAETLPDVVYATDNLYTCAEDGLNSIREGIRKHNLNRVVVASCTPRTHAPLFQATCESAGLNKYLFTFVNIREHCSWVHMKEKERATEKARDLIRMGVARSRLLEAQAEEKVDVEPSAVIIGGGGARRIRPEPEQPLCHGEERRGHDQAADRQGQGAQEHQAPPQL